MSLQTPPRRPTFAQYVASRADDSDTLTRLERLTARAYRHVDALPVRSRHGEFNQRLRRAERLLAAAYRQFLS